MKVRISMVIRDSSIGPRVMFWADALNRQAIRVQVSPQPKLGKSMASIIAACSFLMREPLIIDVEDTFFQESAYHSVSDRVMGEIRTAIRLRKSANRS